MNRGWSAVPVWLPISLVSLLLRAPLLLLPGPGRDEAAYYYWAHAGSWGYAPLLLAWVRALEWTGLPALAAIRLPGLIAGTLVVILFDRWLETRGLGRGQRGLALLALILTPWHLLVGSVLHPDALFLAALLGLALALRARHLLLAAVWGGAAVLAKPTGVLLLPVLAAWFLTRRSRRGPAALGLLMGLSLPGILGITPAMVREILDFARLDPGLPLFSRLGLALGSVLVYGGLLLPLGAVRGTLSGWRRILRGDRVELPVLLLALTLVLTFSVAAVFHHQIKGSWFLPALILLWPQEGLRLPRPALGLLLVVSSIPGLLLAGTMPFPKRASGLETAWGLGSIYAEMAGSRETRVSSTRTLSQRFREFRNLEPTAKEALRFWQSATGEEAPPTLLVSDDYGLAARLAYCWPSRRPGLWIPDDGLFDRGDPAGPVPGILIVAVRRSPDRIWPHGPVLEIAKIPHPVTGDAIVLGVPE